MVVPYDANGFAEISELCEAGAYRNFCTYPHRKDAISSKQPRLGTIIFDEKGKFYHTGISEAREKELQQGDSINLLIGIEPPEIVWRNMKGHRIPPKGSGILLPKQYVYLFMFAEGLMPGIVPQMSGRMPVSDEKPIMFYTKPTVDDKTAIGIVVPYHHIFELPEMFTLHHS